MSRSTNLTVKFWLVVAFVFILACDAGSLGLSGTSQKPTSTLSPGSQLPNYAGTSVAFKPSPGGWIAFVKEGNLWLIHPDGSGVKQVTRNPPTVTGAFNLHWSADGRTLAYSQGGVLSLLDIASLSTTALVSDTAGGFDWSGNGQQIAYDASITAAQSEKPSNSGLWVVNVATGTKGPLVKSSAASPALIAPLWSADASRVIYSEPSGATAHSHLLNLITGKVLALASGASAYSTCSWSPTESLIACMNADPAQGQAPGVVMLDSDGSQKREISLPAQHLLPRLGPWSPDGKRLAVVYASDPGGSHVMTDILSLGSADFKTLGPGRASSWSPDGRWIVTDGLGAAGDQPLQPITVINTTSGLASSLSDGSSATWQPGSPDGSFATPATTQTFCMDTTAGFVHTKPKGYSLQFCIGAQHFTYPSLEQGVYAMGPNAVYFVYCSNSGWVYAARLGDPALTRIGGVRDFRAIRNKDIEPRFQIRFLPGYPNLVQIVEQVFNQHETFTLPHRITAP